MIHGFEKSSSNLIHSSLLNSLLIRELGDFDYILDQCIKVFYLCVLLRFLGVTDLWEIVSLEEVSYQPLHRPFSNRKSIEYMVFFSSSEWVCSC